jgi:hypothetical protein
MWTQADEDKLQKSLRRFNRACDLFPIIVSGLAGLSLATIGVIGLLYLYGVL